MVGHAPKAEVADARVRTVAAARADALEQFVTAALVLAIAADRQGDHFGLLTFSDSSVATMVPKDE